MPKFVDIKEDLWHEFNDVMIRHGKFIKNLTLLFDMRILIDKDLIEHIYRHYIHKYTLYSHLSCWS